MPPVRINCLIKLSTGTIASKRHCIAVHAGAAALLIMLCSADRSPQLLHAWGCSVACHVVPHQQVFQLVHAELQQAGNSEWEFALIVWCYGRQLLQL